MGGASLERGVPIATMTSMQELCENVHRLEVSLQTEMVCIEQTLAKIVWSIQKVTP